MNLTRALRTTAPVGAIAPRVPKPTVTTHSPRPAPVTGGVARAIKWPDAMGD